MAYRKAMQEAFPGRNLIGLSWASARKGLSESKSVPITDLLPLMQSPDLACFNVQYGDTTGDTQAAIDAGGKFYAIGNIDLTNDQDELAAMIGALDAVVTCSNSVAHLSAALGVRTILLAPGGRFVLWYWMREGDRTPWYPAMEIIRAKSGWPAAVVEALRKVSITEVVPWRDAGWL
jgi:hypothetical protein